MQCPCGSGRIYERCCGPFISGTIDPPTAEALMRSRYTAYTLRDIDYIGRTFAPESAHEFDAQVARQWAEQSRWMGLEIVSTDKGQSGDDAGTVEFVATYRQDGATIDHHEISRFRRIDTGAWRYLYGEMPPRSERRQTVVRDAPKVGRNDLCPCGSGKKFKKCCGA